MAVFATRAQSLRPPPVSNKDWVRPQTPFRIAGNLYYVGTWDLACYLVTTPKGHILINTGMPGSENMILGSVRKLGFRPGDIKILLTSQAHFDHVGGTAAVKRVTGARMMVMDGDAGVLADGGSSDYFFGDYYFGGKGPLFEPVRPDAILHDHDTIRLGGTNIIALRHAGHTKGSTSFLLNVNDGKRTWRVLVANMPTILSDSFLRGTPAYPNIAGDYDRTFDSLRSARFDIWLAAHAGQFDLHRKHHDGDAYNPAAFEDREGYDQSLSDLRSDYMKSVDSVKPLFPVPSEAQLRWHEMEMNAFVHFTTNTFTDKEWGYGDEPEQVFNPTALDAGQWARTLKETGFRTMILTCKHHDGFCLWPSEYTTHSVKNSPYRNGHGDVVKEASEAAKKYGLQFGVYLSPWDRNRADYGQLSYITYYRNQLKELFTNYGPVFEMWFDGANGGDGYYGGARETRKINGATYYDWPNTLAFVRSIQPEVIFFSDAGPGVRWVGNESGVAGLTNWNTISTDTLYAGKGGIENILNTGSPDGSKWVPAEVDVSIRPGWFYHAGEDSAVKTPQQLFDIYLSSVGRGSTLLLNVPPDRRGLFNERDVASLRGFRKLLDSTFAVNLAEGAFVTASNTRGALQQFSASHLTDGDPGSYWATDDNLTTAELEIALKNPGTINYIVLQEYIRLGQRVSSFAVDAWENDTWREVARGTTVGHKRILKIDPVQTQRIRVRITSSRASPVLSEVAVY